MSKEFKPAWWVPSPHGQTIWGKLFRQSLKLDLRRERFELSDGDFVDLDWLDQKDNSAPIVLLLHGVSGCIDSHYAKGLLRAFHQQGWRAVFMHFRGCSEEPNRLVRGYHCGDTSDVEFVVHTLLGRELSPKLAVVGISMGGIILLRWLNDTAGRNPLATAVAVSVPFDLEKGLRHVRRNHLTKLYERTLINDLQRYVDRKFSQVEPPFDLDAVKRAKNFHEFDGLVTAPLYGFEDASDYYEKTSARRHLKKITIPTLILHAKDDPFTPLDALPTAEELSEHIEFELQEKGGHVGFVGGRKVLQPEYWLETRIPEHLRCYL